MAYMLSDFYRPGVTPYEEAMSISDVVNVLNKVVELLDEEDMVERVAFQFASGVPHHKLGAQWRAEAAFHVEGRVELRRAQGMTAGHGTEAIAAPVPAVPIGAAAQLIDELARAC